MRSEKLATAATSGPKDRRIRPLAWAKACKRPDRVSGRCVAGRHPDHAVGDAEVVLDAMAHLAHQSFLLLQDELEPLLGLDPAQGHAGEGRQLGRYPRVLLVEVACIGGDQPKRPDRVGVLHSQGDEQDFGHRDASIIDPVVGRSGRSMRMGSARSRQSPQGLELRGVVVPSNMASSPARRASGIGRPQVQGY